MRVPHHQIPQVIVELHANPSRRGRAKSHSWEFISVLVLAIAPLQAGDGFGYMVTGPRSQAHAINPEGGSQVSVAWIDNSTSRKLVKVGSYEDGVTDATPQREIFASGKALWSLKLESTADPAHLLSVIEGSSGNYKTRILRFDEEFQEQNRVSWSSNSNLLPRGRMLDGNGKIFLSTAQSTASGRRINASSLVAAPWFILQSELLQSDLWSFYDDNYHEMNYSSVPFRVVSGLDTAVAPDGVVTAVYDYSGIKLRRFGPDNRLLESMKLDGRPPSYSSKMGKTSVAVLEDRTTLLAWEWHDYSFVGATLVVRSGVPYFRGLLPDGTATSTIRLEPWSSKADINDSPAVGLRSDGTGAVAWTVRTSKGSTVYLQRLDANLQPDEPARIVDARTGYTTDQPMVRGDGEGGLFLSWRCSSTTGGDSQIGILDLGAIDRAPASPKLVRDGVAMQLHWSAPPACEVTLWHSPTLKKANAVPLCVETAICGPRMMEHYPVTSTGFYWLSTD